jgi:hypothetical protein
MAYRVTRYEDAFEGVLDEKVKAFIARLEKDGHTEKFTIWKAQARKEIDEIRNRRMVSPGYLCNKQD